MVFILTNQYTHIYTFCTLFKTFAILVLFYVAVFF